MSLYPWFKTSWAQWCASLEQDSVSPATLLVVKDGMGDADFIDLLVRSLLCVDGYKRCGVCHGCRLLDAKSHPDFHLVEPEKNGKPITVEQVRQINLLAQESSQFSGFRVIVIRPADAMNESAANALLKTLEESPAQCRFILTTATMNRVLPTILSRCQQLHVPAPPHQMVVDWLCSETSQSIPPYILKLNDEAPLNALTFIQNQGGENYHELAQCFCDFLAAPLQQAHALTALINQAPAIRLTWLWYLMADAQKVQFGTQGDFLPESLRVAQEVSYELLYSQYRALVALLNQLSAHSSLNSELLILDWLLKFNEAPCLSIPTAI